MGKPIENNAVSFAIRLGSPSPCSSSSFQAALRLDVFATSIIRRWALSRKYHPERRSHAQLAIQFNATTQQTDEPARNGKTKSNAGLSFPAGRSPVKLVKYLLVLLRCNSTASITYLNAPITFRLGPKCESHFSCCRVFDGVRQKIEAHAMQLMTICNNLSKGRIEMSDKSEAFLLGDFSAKSRRFLKE